LIDGKLVNCSNSPARDMLYNSLIMAGLTFCTTIGADMTTGGDTLKPLPWIRALISAGSTFFGSLAIQRGLKKGESE